MKRTCGQHVGTKPKLYIPASGITGIESGRLLIVKPYALGGFRHFPANAALVANFTANTDFADAD